MWLFLTGNVSDVEESGPPIPLCSTRFEGRTPPAAKALGMGNGMVNLTCVILFVSDIIPAFNTIFSMISKWIFSAEIQWLP